MIIRPALISPLRWIDTSDYNKSFDGNFAVNQLSWDQSKRCYFQPFQTDDRLKIQVIADAIPPDLDIVNVETNQITASVPFVATSFYFPDYPTYVCYELDYSFAALAIGRYYASLGDFTSEPFDLQTEHLNTTLIKYKHSDNDYDVVFDTGIEFEIRVQSIVRYDRPKNQQDIYYDQPHSATQLNGVAFRQMKYYVGYGYGVPNWMMDKISHIFQLDQLAFDDVPYAPNPDAEFEVELNDDNNFIGGNIEIQPKDNNFIQYITTGTAPQPSFTPVQKVERRFNISGDTAIAGVFKADSNLEKVIVYKTGADYTLKIGTTNGGNDIGEFFINVNTGSVNTVEWTFTGTSTVYLSGAGLNADSLTLVYKQLDESPVPLTQTTPTDALGKGAKMMWDGTYSDFLLAFDEATGLGLANTKWSKWCVAGTNGTTIVNGKVHFGIDTTDYSTIGTEKGNEDNLVTVERENLPDEGLFTLSGVVNGTGGDIPTTSSAVARAGTNGGSLAYELRRAGDTPSLGLTSPMGSGTALDITPDGINTVFIVKLEE